MADNQKRKALLYIIVGVIVGVGTQYILDNYAISLAKKNELDLCQKYQIGG